MDGGVLRRTGHTEAAIDLAVMAGYPPAGVLVEILNEDGTMARLPQLFEIAKKLDLKLISIEDLIAYRMDKERLVREVERMDLDTPFGPFELICFEETNTNLQHLVIKKGEWKKEEPVLVRVHAGSNMGELFARMLKDTGNELHKTLYAISNEGKGALLMLRYKEENDLMQKIMRTLKAQQVNNERLNPFFKRQQEPAQKNIGIGSQILHEMGIRKIRLLTNNPRKRVGLIGYDLEIVENVPL